MTPLPPTTQTSTVTVGGHTYRVNSSASADELERLAAIVDERLLALPLGQRGDPKSLVLVALGLAHELEHAQQVRQAERSRMGDRVRSLLTRIDDALGHVDANGDPLPLPALRPQHDSVAEPARAATQDVPRPPSLLRHPNAPNTRSTTSSSPGTKR
jgi:cell division protein ZapA